MKFFFIVTSALILGLLVSCKEKRTTDGPKPERTDTVPPAVVTVPVKVSVDTLQFVHFDGNYDYWYAFFINKNKDTVRLVTEDQLPDQLVGKLLQVKWRPDTLFEAGDNDRAYNDKRLVSYQVLPGAPFVKPVTEQMALQAVKDLDDFKANADRAGISKKPTAEEPYYQVETSTEADGNLSRFKTFRVYIFPKYEIRVYEPGQDKELSLEEWRKAYN